MYGRAQQRRAWHAGALGLCAYVLAARAVLADIAPTSIGAVTVPAERPDPTLPERDGPSFVTVIDAQSATARTASVADLLEQQAGVHLRSRGGLGSFTSVSIRGSEEAEVAVLVDGVPLSRAASGTIDLSQIPVDGLLRVEIWRGTPPIELGAEAIGGAINLITNKARRPMSWRAQAGAGSFGARNANASWGQAAHGSSAQLSAGYRGANGDFSYYDNGGTLYYAPDDHIAQRRNNGFDQLALDAELTGKGSPTFDWRLGAHGFLKRQGVPGLATAGGETTQARLDTGRALIDATLSWKQRHFTAQLAANFLYERSAFSNPLGEAVGPFGPNVSEGNAIAGGVRGRADIPIGRHQLASLLAELRAEERIPYDLLRIAAQGSPARRVLYGAGLVDAVRLLHDAIALEPALRIDGDVAALGTGPSGKSYAATQHNFFVSPRLGIRFRVASFLSVRASAGRFVRFPTLLEQFGDGAFILGAPALKSENAWGGDAGVSAKGSHGPVSGSLEAAFFGRRVGDAIVYIAGGNTVVPTNLGDTRTLGAELRGELDLWKWAHLGVDYTFVDAVELDNRTGAAGKQLPGRPAHELGARVEVGRAPIRLSYELAYAAAVYRDAQNYTQLPAHALHAIGATLSHGPLSLVVEVRNLADLRVANLPLGGSAHAGQTVSYPLVDYFNYPLPGRAVYATLTVKN